jgi:hypothetical protein
LCCTPRVTFLNYFFAFIIIIFCAGEGKALSGSHAVAT